MNDKPEEQPRWKSNDAQDSESISNTVDDTITESAMDAAVMLDMGILWAFAG